MGKQLLEFYEKAKAKGGLKGQMRLAILTTVPSTKAATEPDSPELIQKFQNAMNELEKEFK